MASLASTPLPRCLILLSCGLNASPPLQGVYEASFYAPVLTRLAETGYYGRPPPHHVSPPPRLLHGFLAFRLFHADVPRFRSLGKAIDDVVKTLNDEVSDGHPSAGDFARDSISSFVADSFCASQYDEERIIDLTECISRMEDLMDDLQNNAQLRPIIDDGEGDIPLWNRMLAKYFRGKDFMNAPWLFAEAYKYRRCVRLAESPRG